MGYPQGGRIPIARTRSPVPIEFFSISEAAAMVIPRASRLAVILVLSVVLAVPVLAQTSAGILKGAVVDKDGSPLPGATVSIENPSLGVKDLGGVTNAQGEYRVSIPQPGKGYIVRASMPSYQTIVSRDVEIPAGRTIVLNITLRPAIQEIVRVQGKEDVVDTAKVEQVTKISSEFISGLPVLGRDYQDVLTLAPGVTDVNNTGNPNIHGARDTDVVTLVDGVSTTDPFTGQFGQNLNVESIEEIQVITSGASAEYSRAQGGFVNIITKSGGNEFKGTFKFAMRTQKLDGDGAGIDNADVRGGLGENNGFRNLAFTDLYPFVSIGGAFIKDHLWYYFAPEYSQVETPVNAGTQAFVQTTKSARVTGKVTWGITPRNKLAFSVLYDNTKNFNLGLDSLHGKDTAYTFVRGGPTITFQDNAIMSPTVSLESTISRFDQTFSTTPATNPDTNGNGILTVDNRPDLGGNQDHFIQLRERDPGEDFDADGRFDVFEDYNHDGNLNGCEINPITGDRVCFPPSGLYPSWPEYGITNPDGSITLCEPGSDPNCLLLHRLHFGEDRDLDGRLTGKFGCEGGHREDINCNGLMDAETDLNGNGKVDCPNGINSPDCEDKGIPCTNPALCPNGYEPGTQLNGKFDSEDRNGNQTLDDQPFPNWVDRNHDGFPDRGEFTAPSLPDQQYVISFNTNRRSGPYFFDDNDSRTRNSWTEDLSYYVDNFFGSHDIKIGTRWEKEGYDAGFSQRPIWQIDTGAVDQNTGQIGGTIAAFLPTQENATNSAGSDNIGFYLQDSYKPLPNLTVGLGLRFDREAVSSHGYEFFDPVQQRREFDGLSGLAGEAQDFNADGILSKGIENDPLFSGGKIQLCDTTQDPLNCSEDFPSGLKAATLKSTLNQVAPTRFTRHNFNSQIESVLLPPGADPTQLQLGRPRAPQDFTITNNNLAPRLSLAWDPWADGKSKASASWGRYFDKLFLQTVVPEEGPDLLSPYYGYDSDGVDPHGLPDNKVGRVISKSPPNAYQVDRGLKTPFTDEMTIGFQREVAPEVSISVTYIQRKFRDQLQDIDVNHTTRLCSLKDHPSERTPSGYCDTFGLNRVRPDNGSGGDAGKKGPDERVADGYPDLFINNFNFNQILRVGNYNYQSYDGIELAMTRRLSRKWQMDASYVFSKAKGQADSFTSESGNDPSVTELKSGYLDFDQRHVAQFHAIAYLPGDWQFGGGVRWASGLPWSNVNRFQSADNVDFPQTRRLYGYRDPNTNYFITETRNIHRNDSVYRIDLRTEKRFVIGQVTAGAFFEVFNLLNTDDLRVTEIDTGFNTLQATETRDFGRRFQFGIHMDF
jgi:outer membrane receptor protein involved in Fe transport